MGSDNEQLVRVRLDDQVGTLALDHYEKRNALGRELVADALRGLGELEAAGARAVVLRSAQARKVWSAGHSVPELPHGEADPVAYDDPMERLIRAIREYPGPVVAMIQGSVWGGALDVVMNCDIVIGDSTCAFAITPAKLGLPYNTSGLLHLMTRVPLNIAKEMLFTAGQIDSARAERLGLVNWLVEDERLEAFTYELAQRAAELSPIAIRAMKEQLTILQDSMATLPATAFERIEQLRSDAYQSNDYVEGLAAFTERRKPRFEGAPKCAVDPRRNP